MLIEADNGGPLIGVSGAVQCLLKHATAKGNRISLGPFEQPSIKSRRCIERARGRMHAAPAAK